MAKQACFRDKTFASRYFSVL